MTDLEQRIAKWHERHFGKPQYEKCMKKLWEECTELGFATEDGDVAAIEEEAADCFIVLSNLVAGANFGARTLMDCVASKLAVIELRTPERVKRHMSDIHSERFPVMTPDYTITDTAPEPAAEEPLYDVPVDGINTLAEQIHEWAVDKGFWHWPDPGRAIDQIVAKQMLIVTEVAEWTEGTRAGNPRCDKVGMEGFSNGEEEAADTIIRILDLCACLGYDIGGAIEAKMAVNHGRPHKHGKLI